MVPVRIQRKRTKGWRMPLDAIYVGRPTKFGNPYNVNSERSAFMAGLMFIGYCLRHPEFIEMVRKELRGKDLACWCELDDHHCHADTLLTIANKDIDE